MFALDQTGIASIIAITILTVVLVERRTSAALREAFIAVESWGRLFFLLLVTQLITAGIDLVLVLDPTMAIDPRDLTFFQDERLLEKYLPVIGPSLLLAAMLLLLRWRSYVLLAGGVVPLAAVARYAVVEPSGAFPNPYIDLLSGIPLAERMLDTGPLLVLAGGALTALYATRCTGKARVAPFAAGVGMIASEYLLIPVLHWGTMPHGDEAISALIVIGILCIPFMRGLRTIAEAWRNLCGVNPQYPWQVRHELCVGFSALCLIAAFHLHHAYWESHRRFDHTWTLIDKSLRVRRVGLTSVAEMADPSVLREVENSSALDAWVLAKELSKSMESFGLPSSSSQDWIELRQFWRSDQSSSLRNRIDDLAPVFEAYHILSKAEVVARGDEPQALREGATGLMRYHDVVAFRVGRSIADRNQAQALNDIRAIMSSANPADWTASNSWWFRSVQEVACRCLSWYMQEFRDDPAAMAAARELVREQRRAHSFPRVDSSAALREAEPYEFVAEPVAMSRLDLGDSRLNAGAYADSLAYFQVAFSLELYRHAHGSYPASLEQLIPEHFPSLPRQLWNGEPFLYEPQPNGLYILWRSYGELHRLIPSDLQPSLAPPPPRRDNL